MVGGGGDGGDGGGEYDAGGDGSALRRNSPIKKLPGSRDVPPFPEKRVLL